MFSSQNSEAYLKPSPTSKMKLFAKKVNGWKPFTISISKSYILDVQMGSEYATETNT